MAKTVTKIEFAYMLSENRKLLKVLLLNQTLIIRWASGPRRVRSRLRCFVMLPMLGTRGPAILGVYRIPPRAKRGAAWGESTALGLPLQARRRSVDGAPKPRVPESYEKASQNHDRI